MHRKTSSVPLHFHHNCAMLATDTRCDTVLVRCLASEVTVSLCKPLLSEEHSSS